MTSSKFLKNTEKMLSDIFEVKAPALPKSVKDFIVKYGPYFSLISLLIYIPVIISLSFVALFSFFNIAVVLSLLSLVFTAMAIPGLFKKTRKSWLYLFYAALIYMVANMLRLNLGALIINGAIQLYFLFQIRSYYKN